MLLLLLPHHLLPLLLLHLIVAHELPLHGHLVLHHLLPLHIHLLLLGLLVHRGNQGVDVLELVDVEVVEGGDLGSNFLSRYFRLHGARVRRILLTLASHTASRRSLLARSTVSELREAHLDILLDRHFGDGDVVLVVRNQPQRHIELLLRQIFTGGLCGNEPYLLQLVIRQP